MQTSPDLAGFAATVAMMLSACEAPPGRAAGAEPELRAPASHAGNSTMAINKRFRTLEDYLAHLELTQKPVDGPWYREVRPGVYELQTGNLRVLDPADEPKRIFTRKELERELGFDARD